MLLTCWRLLQEYSLSVFSTWEIRIKCQVPWKCILTIFGTKNYASLAVNDMKRARCKNLIYSGKFHKLLLDTPGDQQLIIKLTAAAENTSKREKQHKWPSKETLDTILKGNVEVREQITSLENDTSQWHFWFRFEALMLFQVWLLMERWCQTGQHGSACASSVVDGDADGTFLGGINCLLTAQSLRRFPLKAHILY